ncbi:MAG: hypothetical protein NZ912_06205, partial [Ignisphaera sp.]|nr:hypothetical protein [Ignisphaera sp.]
MKYTKTIPTIILATLIILGTISPMLFTATPKTLAQGSITVSSDYFNPYKAIMVEVRGDYGPNITVLITNDLTGDTLNLRNVPRVAPNYYVFYLGGPEADVEYPISGAPTIRIDENVDKGTPIRIDVLGAALTYVVRYDVVKPTVTLDRREYPYRRNATIVISYIDEDADHDPTARDELLPGNVGVDITLIKADGTVVSETTDLEELGAVPSREALVRGGRFEFTITISKINDVLAEADVGKDDRVLLSFYTKGDAQGGDEWMDEKTTVDFKAVYKYPSVSITFNYQSLTIDVTSPDDNVDSRVKDTLDPEAEAKVTLEVGGKYCDISAEDFREIGVNANTFRMTFRVVWGTDYMIDCLTKKTVTLPSNTDGPFTATARYY